MKKNKIIKIFKIILILFVITILIGIIVNLFPFVRNLSTPEGQEEFKQKIESTGILGFLMLFGLEIAKMFLIVIPRRTNRIISRNVLSVVGEDFYLY